MTNRNANNHMENEHANKCASEWANRIAAAQTTEIRHVRTNERTDIYSYIWKKQTQETRVTKILFCSPYLPRELGAENRDKMTRFQLQISFNIHERSMENDREDEEWSKDIIDLLGRTTSTFGKYSKWKINNWNEFQILMMFWINEPMSYSLSWEHVKVWL